MKAGADVYFFANSSALRVTADVTLRGRHDLELWDPHTGAVSPVSCSHDLEGTAAVTRVRVDLGPVKSVFFVSPENVK